MYRIKNCWYNIRYGLRNLRIWFRIIWNDRDWDYEFLYRILKHKLLRMEYLFRNDAMVGDSEEMADQMDRCIIILDRLIEDKYFEEAEEKLGIGDSDIFFLSNELKEKDLKELFGIIKNDIESWWD